MNLIEYPDSEAMMMDLAQAIAGELNTTLMHDETATLAVPGGSTPGPMFDALSAADLEWSRITVILTDERRVPADHERSNERLLRERLLVGRAAEARFLRLVPEGDDDMPALHAALAERLPLSVLVLGMGADMHTASLFPGSRDLGSALDTHAPPLMAVEASGDLEDRLTLTAPVLRGAISTHLLITGAEKRAAVERARTLPPTEAPVSVILGGATVHWAP